ILPADGAVVAWSANVGERLGLDLQPGTSAQLSTLLPDIHAELVASRATYAPGEYAVLEATVYVGGTLYQCIYHEHASHGFLEFLPDAGLSVRGYREKLRALRQYSARIMAAATFEDAAQTAAEAGRALLGFARVKIYDFQPDGAGKVIAEAKADHMPTYLGLYFPEFDIPKQSRYLLKLVPSRALGTSQDDDSPLVMADPHASAPLDLSRSVLRSPSKLHTEYLRNMGVASTFTTSLIDHDELWGLIACHHDAPGMPPFDLWGVMRDLGGTLMVRLAQERARQQANQVRDVRAIEGELAKIVESNNNLEDALAAIMPILRKFLQSDGFVFQYGTQSYCEGEVPPGEFIDDLLDWVRHNAEPDSTFVTSALPKRWPAAQAHAATACGVLIEPISLHRVCHLIWFRGPVTKTATWAGDPEGKEHRVEADGSRTITPRNSFDNWKVEHANESVAWHEAEITAAHEILKTMLDIMARQMLLARTNKNMETFSYAAAHDLKTPVRHIRMFLELIREGGNDAQTEQDLLLKASQASDRLTNLIDGMVRYLVMDNGTLDFDAVDLLEVLDSVRAMVGPELARDALRVSPLPTVHGARELLTTLFLNLIQNSLKFRSPERALCIEVSAQERIGAIVISVIDNGVGIQPEFAGRVFEPLFRLQSQAAKPGAGLGLAICRRIVDLHHGTIVVNPQHSPGTRIDITLPYPA
ncbi:MAG: ATP-binding protein, partial [Pseudomonadota bacterium]